MATYLHDVEAQDVLDTLPVNTTSVTMSSAGLNIGQVDALIERGAGQVNAALERHGIQPEQLGTNAAQLARDAIIAYAAAYSLERLGAASDQIERRMREHKELLATLRTSPQDLGAAQDGNQTAAQAKSNICLSDRAHKRFDRRGYTLK